MCGRGAGGVRISPASQTLRGNLHGIYRGIVVDIYGSIVSLTFSRTIWNDRTRRNSLATSTMLTAS